MRNALRAGGARPRRRAGVGVGAMCVLIALGELACTSGKDGGTSAAAAPEITSFTASPGSVDPGLAASLVGVFANGTGAIDHGIGAVTSGVAVSTEPLTATTTFTLTVTSAAGARVTRTATITVGPAAGAGTVTVLRRGTSGDLEPVPGVAIHRSSASTGAFLETRVTDSAGLVDFGAVGARLTLSVVRPAAGAAPKTVVSFVGIPTGAVKLRLDRLPGPPDVLADVSATLTPAGSGATALLPSGAFPPATVSVTREDLQSDGKVTMLGFTGGGESGPLSCGAWLDQPLPSAGANVPISLGGAATDLAFTADAPVALTVAARRKDATFAFPGDGSRTSGTVSSCVGLLPGADTFAVTASAWVATVTTYEGYAFVTTVKSRRAGVSGPTLPATLDLTMPAIAPDALSYGAGTIHATALGALAGDLDLAVARVIAPDLAWHVYASDANALALPTVPGVSAPTWSDGVDVETELSAVEGVAGFDALWAEVRQAGSVEAALLAHAGTATAATRMTRFTPLYTIGFDGYTWERYGLVTSDSGIHCGNSCSGSYRAGTTATLTATPNPGAVFGGWGGDCAAWGTTSPVNVLVDRGYTCNPSFGPAVGGAFSLTVAIAGGFPALIQSDDGSIKCGDDTSLTHFGLCSTTGSSGYGMTLTASPTVTTTVFDVRWLGDCTGTGWSTFVALDGNRTCSVELTPHPP